MRRFICWIIRAYQVVSRYGAATPLWLNYSGCRSWPTCSDYAIDAIQRQGVLRGGLKSIARIVRCNPL
jgi:putative membrane protein insertion efficiency factor